MLSLIHKIRQNVPNEEFDYPCLKSFLKEYSQPRDKITRMLKNSEIIRVKKGLYVFGPHFRNGPYSKEVLANLIYGPSYVSLEYALAFYQLIPERVETVTSITNKRNKFFKTPVGHFSYQYLKNDCYQVGVTRVNLDETHAVLMATKEKALADLLFFKQLKQVQSKKELQIFLTENLRLEKSALKKFNKKRLRQIAAVYQSPIINLLLEIIL